MNRQYAAAWEHCGQGRCGIRLVHNVPKGPYLLPTLISSPQDVMFSMFCVRPPSFLFKRSQKTHKFCIISRGVAKQTCQPCMLAGSRGVVILLQQYLMESISLLHMKNKERDGLPWSGWPPRVTRCIRNGPILRLMLLQKWGSMSDPCFLPLSYFSLPHFLKCKLLNSLCDLPLWPREIIVT